MTSQNKQEYIITEEQLREIIFFAYADFKDEENIHESIKDSLKSIRSRPYNKEVI